MLRAIFVSVLLTFGIGAALWSRYAALLVYVWFALFRPQEWIWFDITSLRLSLVLAILLVVPCLITGVLPTLANPLSIGAILAFVACLLAQTNAANPEVGWLWIDQFGRLLLVSLLATTLLNTPRRLMLFMAVVAASIGFHSAKAGVTALTGGGTYFAAGLAGPFVDNNGYALAVAMILPFLWASWQYFRLGSKLEQWGARGCLWAVPLSMLTVVGTMSRAGFLALAAATFTYIMLQRRRVAALAGGALICLVALPFVPLPEGYFDRLQTIRSYEEQQEASALSRLYFWRIAMDMVADQPLGIGLRNFEFTYDRYDTRGEFGTGRSVHSSHFQVLAELGYFGALVWCSMFAYAVARTLSIRRAAMKGTLSEGDRRFFFWSANALLVSMVAFVVGGAFIALALNDLTWYTFAMVAALDRMAAAAKRAAVAAPVSEAGPKRAFMAERQMAHV